MTNEFNLSERILTKQSVYPNLDWIEANDVKEFIRLLKEELHIFNKLDNATIDRIIDKLSGDKLK